MQCKQCGEQLSNQAVFCPKCGARCVPEPSPVVPSPAPKQKKQTTPPVQKSKSHNTVGIVSIICLTIVFVTIASVFTVVFLKRDADDATTSSKHTDEIISKKETEEPVEEPTDAPTKMPTDQSTHAPTPSPTVAPSLETTPVVNPKYRLIENTTYFYQCDVPTHFIQSGNTYSAPDGSAEMRLEARNNTNHLTVDNVFNSYTTEFGGEIHYSVKKDDWFVLSIVSTDGVHHYIKGFVDDYIRVFFFDSSGESLDVYRGYIEHIEDSFKRTDQ